MASPRIINANGNLSVDLGDGSGARWGLSDNDPLRATFGVFVSSAAPASAATDILTIQGSATKLVRVRALLISGTATAAANVQVLINRRTTANTGGTFTPQTLVNRDKNDDSATSVVNLYTANPSALGTSIGIADGGRLNVAPAANGSIDRLLLQYGWLNDKAPVLRGVSDFLCIGLGGVAIPAGCNFDFNIVLSEE